MVGRKAGLDQVGVATNLEGRPSPPLQERHSSVTTVPSASPSPPPPKKRKLTPLKRVEPQASASTTDPLHPSSALPEAKPFSGSPRAFSSQFTAGYVGDLIVEGWSTTSDMKGSPYLNNGDSVRIQRDDADARIPASSVSKSSVNGLSKGKGGQMKLAFASKPKSAPNKRFASNKENNIVRFLNSKKVVEVGRLPNNTASWLSKLMDLKIVSVSGTVIDCPKPLRTGNNVILRLKVYMLPVAFQSSLFMLGLDSSSSNPEKSSWHEEGKETLDEQILRERKVSLLKLFDAVNMKPTRSNRNRLGKQAVVPLCEGLGVAMSSGSKVQPRSSGKAKEVIGDEEDAEEVEVEGEELTDQQVANIYTKAQQSEKLLRMPEMQPSSSFTLTLRPYQKQALKWMYDLEMGKGDEETEANNSMHPLWEEYNFAPDQDEFGMIDLSQPEIPFYMNPNSGELSLEMPKMSRNCRGVGLGKSIMLASLLHTNRGPEPPTNAQKQTSKPKGKLKLDVAFRPKVESSTDEADAMEGPSSTLIVAPVSLLSQWQSELTRSGEGGESPLSILLWHGQSRAVLGAGVDVVITSYGTLASEHAKVQSSGRNASSPLFSTKWKRIVLDEAHYIKSRTSKTAKAVYGISRESRCHWALTGTPITNRLDDLFSLLHFLQFQPWSNFAYFNSFITKPFLDKDPRAIDVVQVILETVLLRREKTTRDASGNPIVQLPPKTIEIKHLELSEAEEKLYHTIYRAVKRDYDKLNASGQLTKNVTSMLARIMTLRRAACHPALVRDSKFPEDDDDIRIDTKDDDAYAHSVLQQLGNYDDEDEDARSCPICFETMEDDQVLVSDCKHTGCKACIVGHLRKLESEGKVGTCPICSGPAQETELLEVVRKHRNSIRATSADTDIVIHSSPSFTLRKNNFESSTKLDALVSALRALRGQDPCFRAVVFSQWTSFLDLISRALDRERFAWSRLDGTMSQPQRARAIEEFVKPGREARVFMISLKSGGVGLNLTTANFVFMMDCWWNEAVEDQAVDRVHRIGQDRPVMVTKFIIKHTVEERIIQIQKRKSAIASGALRGRAADSKEVVENFKIMFED
ncbi:P-loop containing nucleoside triphosphate hydrolase protein [Cantharellus anzutake]|uniref:P-loop containing nucleoside triphosphate hydrolase protein n=1 Tax=Cantharellus anzutake TaxID=1750568 RepID=UPI0019070019|nr:P-loop containing nucleoside triphosphate hydrolase protein [Cantharellus anzutake]KAF8338153.1 P-loop containing nucleoside triphosphate hydrolase protein [Cantharellus anzutake]